MNNLKQNPLLLVKQTFFDDHFNSWFASAFIGVLTLDLIIWETKLASIREYIYFQINLSPIVSVIIIAIINSLLSAATYQHEKAVSHLLSSTTLALAVLVFILEIFYSTNL